MEVLFILMLLGLGGLLVASPIVAIIALVKVGDLRADLARTNRLLRDLEGRIPEPSGPSDTRPDVAATPDVAAPRVPQTVAPPARTPSSSSPDTAAPARARKAGLEERLAPLLLPGLGAVAVVLAVVFLVRHAIEMEWLGPAVQCLLGSIIGVALIAGGELLRRHPVERRLAALKPSLITPALVAAGVAALFVSIYAAYGVYDLLAPLVAFAMLAAVWAAAIGLSLLHGPFVAALGILGGFLVPILVQTGHPSAYSLFPYLTAVSAAALAVLRYKGWGWLAWGTLAGAAGWPVLWMIDQWYNLGAPAVGGYLTLTAILFTYLPSGLVRHDTAVGWPRFLWALPRPALLAWSACAAMLALALLLVWVDDFGAGSVISAALLGAFLLVAGRRDVTFDALAIGAALLAAIILASWNLPYWPGRVDILDTLPPGLKPFAAAAAGYAALFGIGGLALLRGAARPGLWAGVSAAVPVAALAIAFWRIRGFEIALEWAAMGLVLAALCLGAASWTSRRRDRAGMDGALAAYAVGVVAAVSLALAMALENAWLTVALSLQLPAMAWIHQHTKVRALRHVALVVAGSVLVRLVFNHELFDYRLGATPGLNWMLYGYGLPTLAFYVAARLFRRSGDDRLVLALEAGALAFLTLFWTLEIADIVNRGQFLPGDNLLETSLRTIAWATIAFALLWQCRAARPRPVAVWGWRILAGLAAAQIALLHLVGRNPLLTGDPVGTWPLANLLLLAFAMPAALALAFRIETRRQGLKTVADAAGIGGLVLVFVWLSLELRHAFHGTTLNPHVTSDGEWYAYSALWLIYALLLLAAGMWRGNTPLRHAALAVLMLTVCKVFLFDMAEVGGLFRVASFLGLGLSLIAIGWVYWRYVSSPAPPDAAAPA
ncbi:MAG: DUF2339 domain-containing protein [Rhodospirillales bacterium]|nr:MAG: DUF2339 domain-containing protein [Rhodospirillales bacterium]